MYNLTEEETMLQTAVRGFADREITPKAQKIDESDEFPTDLIRKLAEVGYLSVSLPSEYGGGGGSTMSYVLTLEEICRASAAVGLCVAVQNSLAGWTLTTYGTQAQKDRYLRVLASGEALGAYSLTEPDAGSDAGSLKTTAVRDGDDYVLNGRKAFCTQANIAGVTILFATVDREQKHRGVTAFLIDRGTPGFQPDPPLHKMGIRGSPTVGIVLEDVRVPATNRLGEEGQGFKIAMSVLDVGRIGIAAQALGIAQSALDHSVEYAGQREQFGRPIAEFQGVGFMLADMYVRVEASRLLTYKAAHLKESGQPYGMAASAAKLYASETAVFCTDKAVQVHGGYGYVKDSPVERLYRDAKITEIYEGTSEIQRLVISRELLKGSR